MLLSTGGTSLGALCSRGGATFARPVSPDGKFPSYTIMLSCKVLAN